MTTVQITLTTVERGDQDWSHAIGAIEHCTPINRTLRLRDGLSGAIDTHANGFRVQVDVFDEFAQADRLARALFAEWGYEVEGVHAQKFDQVREAVLAGIGQGSRIDA